MIPINPEEWREVSKQEYNDIMSKHQGRSMIELFDGEKWIFYAKESVK